MSLRVVLASVLGMALMVSSASAEYPWVLWEAREDYSVTNAHVESTWTILRTYGSLKECRLDQAKLLSGETTWVMGREKRADPERDGAYVPQSGGHVVVWTIKRRPMCVPGTLDPRPKEK